MYPPSLVSPFQCIFADYPGGSKCLCGLETNQITHVGGKVACHLGVSCQLPVATLVSRVAKTQISFDKIRDFEVD